MGVYNFTPTADGRYEVPVTLTIGGHPQEVIVTLPADGYAHLNAPGCTCRIATVGLDGVILGGVDDCPVHGFAPHAHPTLHRRSRRPAVHRTNLTLRLHRKGV